MTVKELCEALGRICDDYEVLLSVGGLRDEVVDVISDARHNEVTIFAD